VALCGLVLGIIGITSGRSANAQAKEPAEGIIWLEAEQFSNLGGWVNDSQFVDQMGSPYLLAIGLEGPVADATTQIKVPVAGKYCVWVRCRDWVPEHSPGRFQVVIAGKPLDHIFGQSKQAGWIWEDGGEIQLPAGELEIGLRDLTGHYSRCDAVVLSRNPEFRPPNEPEALAAARERFGGVSRQVKRLGPYDTVVVGGGLAGTFAAVASARLGCKTVLVQNRPVLGGNASDEILVEPQGDTTREPLDPGEGGIIEEVRGDIFGYSQRLLRLVKGEPNLELFLNTHATGVLMANPQRIAAIRALDVVSGQRVELAGNIFIDCTGDGVIGVWAGAEYRHGREPRSMYGESRAPEQGDPYTMGGTLRYATEQLPTPVEFRAPAWAHKFAECEVFGQSRHPQLRFGGWQWVIEYGGMLNTYHDAEEIRDELLRIIWGMWDHAKNHCPKLADQAPYFKLVWVSHVVGKRESRRLIGDYVMTEHDIARQTLFEDRVAYGGWGIDLHPPGGFYAKEAPAEFSHKVKFSIPFRSLYSKDIENLMMAGRCISVSHAALGATRVMITCGVQGQAVGTAAALCKKFGTLPRELGQKHIGDLQQQLLKDGCYIIDLPNQDPRDLALRATVTASSVSPPVEISWLSSLPVHPLNHDRAVMFRHEGGKLERIWLALISENKKPTTIRATLCRAEKLGQFTPESPVAHSEATVPAASDGWVAFEFNRDLPGGYYFVWLPLTKGIHWRLFTTTPPETARAYRSGNTWQPMTDCYMFTLAAPERPPAEALPRPPKKEDMFAPANVINGFARAIRGWPNSWRPTPDASPPHWIELNFGKPVDFNTVHVSFQSQAMRAEVFRIEVPQDGAWQTVAKVLDNDKRRCVLRLDPTIADRLRIVIERARPNMGICEIRVYNGP